jgi:hypothetical protein
MRTYKSFDRDLRDLLQHNQHIQQHTNDDDDEEVNDDTTIAMCKLFVQLPWEKRNLINRPSSNVYKKISMATT